MSDLPSLGYSRPGNLTRAIAALRRPGACIYAGGTDLLVSLQHREASSAWVRELVDIKDVAEACGIERDGARLRIGALTTAAELGSNALVRHGAPALREAARATSSPLLRARGTLGGNLVTPHPSGDVATALLSLDAVVEVMDTRGVVRRMPIRRFLSYRGSPRRRGLILAVHIECCTDSAYEKLGHRSSFSRAIVAASVAVRPGGMIVALAGLHHRPIAARIARSSGVMGLLAAFGDHLTQLETVRRDVAVSLVMRAIARIT